MKKEIKEKIETKTHNIKGIKIIVLPTVELKEIRQELKIIRDERRELLKDYRYWKIKEDKLKEEIKPLK